MKKKALSIVMTCLRTMGARTIRVTRSKGEADACYKSFLRCSDCAVNPIASDFSSLDHTVLLCCSSRMTGVDIIHVW